MDLEATDALVEKVNNFLAQVNQISAASAD